LLVDFEDHRPIGLIVLNRPAAWNAINPAMADELAAAIARLESDPELWVGVLAARGPAFSVGADLKAAASGERSGGPMRGGFLNPVVTRPRSKPLIAAVEAVAAGGGFELVLECDLVVASTSARFLLPEVKWSLIAAAGGAIRLHQHLPRNVAMDLLLTGRELGAEEAHRWGVVNRLVAPGEALATAMAYAAEVCEAAPVAVRESRRVLLAASAGDEEDLWLASDVGLAAATGATDFAEGMRSFLEKRPPRWQGS
jgi:enoyl-CoA hydratase